MWASFKYSLLQLVRVPGVLIWTLVFPIVLGSLFVMMFGALDERAEAVSANVVVVDEEQAKGEERSALSFENIARAAQAGAQVGSVFDEETFGGQAFASFMEALGEGDDALFNITYVSEEAAALVRDSLGTDDEYAGYVQYVDGEVRTVLAKATSAAETYEVEPSILMMIMDRYVAEEALIKETLQKNPAALADPGFIETLMAPVEATVRASVTDNAPRESLRYYFALFGMAAFFGASIGLIGFQQIRANASALAARRSLGALSHGKTAFVTLLASWLLSFASLLVLFAFLVVIGGVDFGDRVGICILICLVASLCATALGCALAAIPKVPGERRHRGRVRVCGFPLRGALWHLRDGLRRYRIASCSLVGCDQPDRASMPSILRNHVLRHLCANVRASCDPARDGAHLLRALRSFAEEETLCKSLSAPCA